MNVPVGFVRDPSSIGPKTAQSFGWGNQQNQQGNRVANQQPNWDSALRFAQGMNDMNTPFHVGQIKNAFGAHANAMSGLGNQIGSQLNANADRVGRARQQAVGWAQSQNVLPFEFTDPNARQQFGGWLNMDKQFQNHRAGVARQNQFDDQMKQYSPELQQAQNDAYIQNQRNQMEMERQRGYAQLPLQQEKMKMLQGLFGNLFSGFGGSGGSPAGSVPNGFTTNFGASGRIV